MQPASPFAYVTSVRPSSGHCENETGVGWLALLVPPSKNQISTRPLTLYLLAPWLGSALLSLGPGFSFAKQPPRVRFIETAEAFGAFRRSRYGAEEDAEPESNSEEDI